LLSLRDQACPNCHRTFGVFTFPVIVWQNVRAWLARVTAIRCPACLRASPWRDSACRHCGQALTFAASVEVVLTPLRRRWEAAIDGAGPRAMRRVQWGHFLLSVAALWGSLGYPERHPGNGWSGPAALSALFLAVILLLMALLMPRRFWVRLLGWSRLTRFGLVFNYFTALLWLQPLIQTWEARAQTLAVLIGITYLGGWLLTRLLWPMYCNTANIVLGAAQGFNASQPQGRRVSDE
jgi:hypothetical protein